MSFDVILTKSAQELGESRGVLPDLEERTRDEIAELPGEGLEELERRLFHAFALEDGTEVICSLTADGAVRVDACEADVAA
ncbi:hypothetical protein [Methylorubrum salsuginis]|uniref:Halobacterial output domain-containing protein n=1 Tax=Methylorubrum salsuginis TaxID=414703 RepID=A0A1I4I569_9HYPH|nr:hypothetical protein [Methylorubrum salsuginis]SFL48971.1 hypothetical protein SAMN04488125_11646 [Methylorubrum salsuginis]